jgi:AcrR family transcriptional regulator
LIKSNVCLTLRFLIEKNMVFTEKQIQILAVAEQLFAQKGFNGTSVRDIAEDAGVNVSMISYYFGSKEGLMEALFKERTSHILPKLEQLVRDESLTPFQKIDILIDDYVQRGIQKVLFYKILLGEQLLDKASLITGLINELKQKNSELMERLIKDGQNKGMIKKDVDILFLLNTLVGTTTQTFINKEYYKKYNGLEHLPKEEFVELLRKNLSSYLKDLFKSILSYEA